MVQNLPPLEIIVKILGDAIKSIAVFCGKILNGNTD
jgi:hypothetical protein